MSENLLRFNKEQKYLIWDVESCNLNLGWAENKAWQLGFVVAQNNKILEEHDFFIKWTPLPIGEGAARVTRFDKNLYESKAQDPLKVLQFFEKYLYDPQYRIIFHNGLRFDVFLHNIFRRNLGLDSDYSYISRAIDTNAIARAVKMNIKYNKNEDFIAFQYKMLSFKKKGLKTNLTALGNEYKIPFDYESLHLASSDVILNGLIFQKLIWQIEI